VKSSRLALSILGVILLLAGITFSLQGANYLGGSAMSGSSFWLYAGAGIAVLGLLLLLGTLVMKSGGKESSTAAPAAPAA
jgi:hypothetical protein